MTVSVRMTQSERKRAEVRAKNESKTVSQLLRSFLAPTEEANRLATFTTLQNEVDVQLGDAVDAYLAIEEPTPEDTAGARAALKTLRSMSVLLGKVEIHDGR